MQESGLASVEGVPAPGEPAPGERAAAPGRRLLAWRASTWRAILLFLGLAFSYGLFVQYPAWNEYSRYDLIRALVADGTTKIDPYAENTGDKAQYQGHYYSDKAPGTAVLGVLVFATQVAISDVTHTGMPSQQSSVAVLAVFESGLVTALLAVLLLRFLAPIVGERWALAIAIGFGLGTIAFPFATMFFGHAASSLFLFAAFCLLWRWRDDQRRARLVGAGLLAGFAVVTELPVVLGVFVLGVWALAMTRRRVVWFVAGGVPMLLLLMAYNAITFGGPFSIGYQYDTVFGQQNSQGILSVVWPKFSTTLELLVGPRGLLRFSPWLALGPLGLLALRDRRLRPAVLVSAAMCAAFLTYNSGALNPLGGWTPGPRYLIPALPFATILAALAPRRVRPLTLILIGYSVVAMLVATVTMPNAPERFADPLTDLWLPRLLTGRLADPRPWLDWGIPRMGSLVILAVGLAVAGIGLAATFVRGRRAGYVAAGTSGAMLALVLVFAMPLLPWGAVSASGAAGAAPQIELASAGATYDGSRDRPEVTLWADIDNRGAAATATRVKFAVRPAAGTSGAAWAAWYTKADWPARARRAATLGWDPTGRAPGTYVVDITIDDPATGTVYLERQGIATIRLDPAGG